MLADSASSALETPPRSSLAPPRTATGLYQLAWRRFRRHRLALLGGSVLGVIAGLCAVAPLVVPESAANRVDPTLFRAAPSLAHPFGSDDVGRDILWRIIYGGRISLAIGALSVAISM